MATNSLLFIPDISGFTEFVNETEITHSRHVISELLEVIIESDVLGMTVSEIEGDAVLFFLEGQVPPLPAVVAQARRTFEAFHTHLKRYERDRICPCGACQTAHRLTLKVVAHGGPIETLKVREFEKPYGSDVILAHRLLKNDIPNREYLLVTSGIQPEAGEAASLGESSVDGQAGPPGGHSAGGDATWATFLPGEATYDSLGQVKYQYLPLGPLRETLPDLPDRPALADGVRRIRSEVNIPLPLSETFELISSLGQRLLWTKGVDEVIYDENRVNRVGTRHQCVIDGDLLEFETVAADFGPNRLVYGERILGNLPVLDPTLYYIMEETPGGTRVIAEVHYRPKPFPKSFLSFPFKTGFGKRLPKTLAAIAEVGETLK